MAQVGPDPRFVARAFVRQYYGLLKESPEIMHGFYRNESVIDRPGPHGGASVTTTTIKDIGRQIMCSAYKGCLAEILSVDAQESLDRGILVAVKGYFVMGDSLSKTFLQTFFLAKQEEGYFVLNDMLRFLDLNSRDDVDVASKTVYVGMLPPKVTKYEIVKAVKRFGPVRQDNVQLITYKNGSGHAFVEFESASSARKACKVRQLTIGENKSYIAHKKSSVGRSSNSNGTGAAGSKKCYRRKNEI